MIRQVLFMRAANEQVFLRIDDQTWTVMAVMSNGKQTAQHTESAQSLAEFEQLVADRVITVSLYGFSEIGQL